MSAAHSFLPMDLARFGVDAGGDTLVVYHVEFVTDEQRRRCARHAFSQGPGYVRVGNVAFAVGTNRQQRRRIEAAGEEHQAVAKDRTRHDGITFVAHSPDFFSRAWLVGTDRVAARA